MSAREWLDELDAARAKGTPGPWQQHEADDEYVVGGVSDDGDSYTDVADTFAFRKDTSRADAALIVAAVNALPELTARLRAVLDVADELERFGSERDRDNETDDAATAASAAAYLRSAHLIRRAVSEATQ